MANGVASLTFAQMVAILNTVIPATSIQKYRLSSIVVDPVNSSDSIVSVEANLGISGTRYQSSNAQKPLRIRCGREYGKDGMWIVTDGDALSAAMLPGELAISDQALTIDMKGATVTQVEVHLRFAWTDPS